VLFFSSGLAWQGLLNWERFLPPLDRAVLVFSLVWIVWLWNFPAPARLGIWSPGSGVGAWCCCSSSPMPAGARRAKGWPSTSRIDQFWELAALFVVLTGMVILLFSRPPGWGFGLGMLGLMLAGFVAHCCSMPASGGLSGYIRLGQLAAYPLLPTLLHRFATEAAPAPASTEGTAPAAVLPADAAPASVPRPQERRRYSAGPRAVHSWLELRAADEPEQIMANMAKAVGHTMLCRSVFYRQRAELWPRRLAERL
jgi:hypothetical protein